MAAAKLKYWEETQADFLDKTGLPRQYGRDRISTTFSHHSASNDKHKNTQNYAPNLSMKSNISPRSSRISQKEKNRPDDVLSVYMNNASPDDGEIKHGDGYKKGTHKAEIEIAEFLHSTFGGNIILLQEQSKDNAKTPDYIWRENYWELKGI